AQAKPPRSDERHGRSKVARQIHPRCTFSSVPCRDQRLLGDPMPKHRAEIDAAGGCEAKPRPGSWIDVEKLQRSVARIPLELDLYQPGKPDRAEQALRYLDDFGLRHHLDKRTGIAELDGKLACAPRGKRGNGHAVEPEPGVRELVSPAS